MLTLVRTARRKPLTFSFTFLLFLAATAASIVFSARADESPEAPAPAPPPPQVQVETIEPQKIRIWHDFSGRLAAVDFVEIRPRVGGTITQVLFEEGSIVAKGDGLFVIDPRPYQAELDMAIAELESAKSRAHLAKDELSRLEGLLAKKAVSKSIYEAAQNDHKVAVAAIHGAEASIQRARLNLEYAHIHAPVSGRISRAEITQGNVIEAGPNAPVLATVVSNDSIYAEFDVSEQAYLKLARSNRQETLPVRLTLGEDNETFYRGELVAFDNRIDTRSGTIRARALFANADGLLVPGMYAGVRVGEATEEEVLLVDDRAVGTNQDQKFVMVVDPNGLVTYREVRLGRFIDGRRLVLDGLKSGDRVMVNSLQRVRPGMTVEPLEIESSDTGELAAN
ncbi:Efflux RND transporter periplasmic adaptor subunit [Sulfidibacter corallicola]|uniref:Efflux RND transporter periplasmic adaptor subunit n=1 Tax=Sulfidibacter corallicola TaxID=2818388 RepID=A0A8A4TMJ2_SULCO|nr:efflux RND transporter periplasmic adaptor subunit [Sulfidibacter corallicola]QTD50770.1 efflux RND transporter periplasmic adaptor subunit [Sulfidibacter corallicola]